MIKIFFDKDGGFLIDILKGSASGFRVFDMIGKLYQADSNDPFDLSKATTKVAINSSQTIEQNARDLFPCIIIVDIVKLLRKKTQLYRWIDAERKYLQRLENVKEIYNTLSDTDRQKGLWPTYHQYIESEKIRVEKLIKRLQFYADKANKFDKNVNIVYGFFNNSSIWIRLVVKDGNHDDQKIINANNELEYFKKIGLYDYGSAIENLDYNIRLQPQNYLDSKTLGHGVHVTPVLYGDEAESLNILRDNNIKIEYNN